MEQLELYCKVKYNYNKIIEIKENVKFNIYDKLEIWLSSWNNKVDNKKILPLCVMMEYFLHDLNIKLNIQDELILCKFFLYSFLIDHFNYEEISYLNSITEDELNEKILDNLNINNLKITSYKYIVYKVLINIFEDLYKIINKDDLNLIWSYLKKSINIQKMIMDKKLLYEKSNYIYNRKDDMIAFPTLVLVNSFYRKYKNLNNKKWVKEIFEIIEEPFTYNMGLLNDYFSLPKEIKDNDIKMNYINTININKDLKRKSDILAIKWIENENNLLNISNVINLCEYENSEHMIVCSLSMLYSNYALSVIAGERYFGIKNGSIDITYLI